MSHCDSNNYTYIVRPLPGLQRYALVPLLCQMLGRMEVSVSACNTPPRAVIAHVGQQLAAVVSAQICQRHALCLSRRCPPAAQLHMALLRMNFQRHLQSRQATSAVLTGISEPMNAKPLLQWLSHTCSKAAGLEASCQASRSSIVCPDAHRKQVSKLL